MAVMRGKGCVPAGFGYKLIIGFFFRRPFMSNLVSCEQFLLRRAAAEQHRVADSMRGLVAAVGHFVELVDQACVHAKSELEEALARTGEAQRKGAADRRRTMAALDSGGLEDLIAERDRLMADLARDREARERPPCV